MVLDSKSYTGDRFCCPYISMPLFLPGPHRKSNVRKLESQVAPRCDNSTIERSELSPEVDMEQAKATTDHEQISNASKNAVDIQPELRAPMRKATRVCC